MNKKTDKKVLIFDMDGTLYEFKGGSFGTSDLRKKVLGNAKLFIMERLKKNNEEADLILAKIKKKYGEDISIALEEEFNINRYDYFEYVWNIPAKDYIKKGSAAEGALLKEASKKFIMVLLSDAPRIWVDRVLEEISVKDLFDDNIFSGEGDERKRFNNAFERIFMKFKVGPSDCIIFGDQEEVDIIPAAEIGIKTVFVSDHKKSLWADYNIKNIAEMPVILTNQ